MAVRHLRTHGYDILETNWRFGHKEIDIIASKGKWIVFVEVKTRENSYAGEPWEAVGKGKQKTIITAAHEYLLENNTDRMPRFDIISIVHNSKYSRLEHLEDAFYPLSR